MLLTGEVDAAFGSSEGTEAVRYDGSDEFGVSDLGKLIRHWSSAFQQSHAGAAIRLRPTRSLAPSGTFDEASGDVMYVGYRLNRGAIDGFTRKYGYKPTPVRVALDTIAVFVHRDNPIRGMTLAQIGSVFSHSPACRDTQQATTWGSVGLTGEWRSRPLQRFGIGSADDMYDYFGEQVLCRGELSKFVRVQPDSAAVARAVSESLNAIGYGRGDPATKSVKTVPLAVEANMPFVEPTDRNAVNGSYPLTRFLHVYVNKLPDRPLTGLQAEFIRFALSKGGQQIAQHNGYIPVTQDVAKKEQDFIFHGSLPN
jgi:phosphate transport system substrate-binding protein